MLSMNVPVDEFTTPDPVIAREDMSIDEVRSLMERHDIRHLPVMRGNAVVGLISERDVRLVSGLTVAEKLLVNASDIMTTVLLTVSACSTRPRREFVLPEHNRKAVPIFRHRRIIAPVMLAPSALTRTAIAGPVSSTH